MIPWWEQPGVLAAQHRCGACSSNMKRWTALSSLRLPTSSSAFAHTWQVFYYSEAW